MNFWRNISHLSQPVVPYWRDSCTVANLFPWPELLTLNVTLSLLEFSHPRAEWLGFYFYQPELKKVYISFRRAPSKMCEVHNRKVMFSSCTLSFFPSFPRPGCWGFFVLKNVQFKKNIQTSVGHDVWMWKFEFRLLKLVNCYNTLSVNDDLYCTVHYLYWWSTSKWFILVMGWKSFRSTLSSLGGGL